jgi:hypothetical protein
LANFSTAEGCCFSCSWLGLLSSVGFVPGVQDVLWSSILVPREMAEGWTPA